MSEKKDTKQKKSTYYALINISLDGEEYAVGTVVPVTAEGAAELGDAVTTAPPTGGDTADAG